MGDFAKALEGIAKLDGVEAVFMISPEGAVVESAIKEAISPEQVAPLALKAMEGAKNLSNSLGRGAAGQSYVEYQNLSLTFDFFPHNLYLAVVGKSGSNLGRIRYEIKRSRKLMEEIQA